MVLLRSTLPAELTERIGRCVFELWLDDCGPSGNSCPATPTLRLRRTDVRNSRANTSQLIRVLWFEAWSNPVSLGERYWDQIVASRVGPIGFMR